MPQRLRREMGPNRTWSSPTFGRADGVLFRPKVGPWAVSEVVARLGRRRRPRLGHGNLKGPPCPATRGKGKAPSGRRELNTRPSVPKTGALPSCATPRLARLGSQIGWPKWVASRPKTTKGRPRSSP
jgi:hypothetical protein